MRYTLVYFCWISLQSLLVQYKLWIRSLAPKRSLLRKFILRPCPCSGSHHHPSPLFQGGMHSSSTFLGAGSSLFRPCALNKSSFPLLVLVCALCLCVHVVYVCVYVSVCA
ncbi:hypothetical protein BKA56DRAFT_13236 [Ilyonectria sp. MPI-CAGE-AT-0026]|nr:hypothetical protein BKA56DRAFT_13236 [Ilyonectria sp. MPI-CAGE-AT-0026]